MITKSKLSVFLERDKVYQTIVYDYQQQDDSKSKGSWKSKVYFQGLIPTKDLARVSPWSQAIFDRDPLEKGHHKWSLEQGRQYYQAARNNIEQGYNKNIEYFNYDYNIRTSHLLLTAYFPGTFSRPRRSSHC